MVGQKNMIKRLRNINTSPTRGGDDKKDNNSDDDTNTKSPTCDPCQSNSGISVHSKTSQDSARSVQTSGSRRSSHTNGVRRNDVMLQMMNMMRIDNERRDRRQEELIVRIMQMQGRNGPQVIVAISPPKLFYGNEEEDKMEFDEWIETVDDYVRQSGQDALTTLKSALDGSAKEAYHAIPVDQRETYEDAVNRLRPLVRPVMSKNVTALKLWEVQREQDEPITKYMQRYLRLYSKTSSRHIERASWLNGLDDKLREKMLVALGDGNDALTLREVMELTVTKAQIMEDAKYDGQSQTGSDSEGDYKEVISESHKRKMNGAKPSNRRVQRKMNKNANNNSYVIEEPEIPICAIHGHCGHDTEECFGILRGRQIAEESKQMRQQGNTPIKTTIPRSRRIRRVQQNTFVSRNSPTPPSADIRSLGANLKIAGQTFKGSALLDTGTEIDVIPRFIANILCTQRLARTTGGQRVKPALARGHIQSQTIVTSMQIDDGPRIEVSCIISEGGSSEVLISPETAQKLGINIQMVRCQPYSRRNSKAAGCVSPGQVYGGSWMRKPWSSIPNAKYRKKEYKSSTQEQEGENARNGMYFRPM